ncbi:MAG: glycosyl hydrolase 53 family protein [Thermofilaceae archaeon]
MIKCWKLAVAFLLFAALSYIVFTAILRVFLLSFSKEPEIPPQEGIQTPRAGDAIAIMMEYGANCFRLRLFVDPNPRDEWGGFTGNNLEYTVRLAKRIKAAEAKLVLDPHYSDTWADPGKQYTPKSWLNLGFEQLVDKVYEYTHDTITAFNDEGALPDMVQIGNEITCGFLWPEGKVCDVENPQEQWSKFATLLKAAIKGVKDAPGGGNIQVILHIHPGGSWETTDWFFSNLEDQGVPYNIIGLSYYPIWHGSLTDLKKNLVNTANKFNKEIFIVETGYPYQQINFGQLEETGSRYMTWPRTPEGQAQFITDVIQAVYETPNRKGMGVLWWYPEAIPVKELTVLNATALFDEKGRALPALKVFKEFRKRLSSEFLLGGDISALGEIERLGGVYLSGSG